MSRPLGRKLAQAIATLAPDAPQQMLVIPVPLHPRRQRARGFNQARLLATSALSTLRRTHPDWQLTLSPTSLVRQRQTTPQASLTPRQRRVNLDRAFHVERPQQIKGRAILLIDDIVTTGATARACAQSLLDAGAASVSIAALARAQMSFNRGHWTTEDAADAQLASGFAPVQASLDDRNATTPHPT